MSLAILLPTYDAYAPVARFTLGRIDACWPEHPEVFVCGIAGSPMPFGKVLPLTADPRDWVGIALDAVRRLQDEGVEWLYLILDDHPPFGPCNANYLNRRLPENAAALGAIQVNLLGWDQHQPRAGRRPRAGAPLLAAQRARPSAGSSASIPVSGTCYHSATCWSRCVRPRRTSVPPGRSRGQWTASAAVSTRRSWSGPTECGATASRPGAAGSSPGACGP